MECERSSRDNNFAGRGEYLLKDCTEIRLYISDKTHPCAIRGCRDTIDSFIRNTKSSSDEPLPYDPVRALRYGFIQTSDGHLFPASYGFTQDCDGHLRPLDEAPEVKRAKG